MAARLWSSRHLGPGRRAFPYHRNFALSPSREGLGAARCPPGITCSNLAGVPPLVHVGIADVVKPRISTANPFYVRVGICYTGNANSHPASVDLFTVTRGYKSWGGGGVDATDPLLRPFYNQLDGQSNGLKHAESCFNLDHQNMENLETCPSVGVTPLFSTPDCPTAQKDVKRGLCIFPTATMTKADEINCSTPRCQPGRTSR